MTAKNYICIHVQPDKSNTRKPSWKKKTVKVSQKACHPTPTKREK